VDAIEVKMDKVEGLLLKNDQVQSDIFDYLKRLEGKITRPPTREGGRDRSEDGQGGRVL
jgi:hypothetical protein